MTIYEAEPVFDEYRRAHPTLSDKVNNMGPWHDAIINNGRGPMGRSSSILVDTREQAEIDQHMADLKEAGFNPVLEIHEKFECLSIRIKGDADMDRLSAMRLSMHREATGAAPLTPAKAAQEIMAMGVWRDEKDVGGNDITRARVSLKDPREVNEMLAVLKEAGISASLRMSDDLGSTLRVNDADVAKIQAMRRETIAGQSWEISAPDNPRQSGYITMEHTGDEKQMGKIYGAVLNALEGEGMPARMENGGQKWGVSIEVEGTAATQKLKGVIDAAKSAESPTAGPEVKAAATQPVPKLVVAPIKYT